MLRHRFPQGVLWTGNGPRLAMAVLLFWTTAVEPVLAQTSPPLVLAQQAPSSGAEQAAPHYSMEDLSYLLEPIALYPDPLLALILSASTFPVQIVEAERWIMQGTKIKLSCFLVSLAFGRVSTFSTAYKAN